VEVRRVVSGGQTGVDRAALDVAIALGLPYGGWCPAGGRAEDRPEPPGLLTDYPDLCATEETDAGVRTERNVRESDATLVVVPRGDWHSPGTDLTITCCRRLERSHLVATVDQVGEVTRWLRGTGGSVLNVAGPRESQSPGIYAATARLLHAVLDDDRTS
jgi:hypothetical protein